MPNEQNWLENREIFAWQHLRHIRTRLREWFCTLNLICNTLVCPNLEFPLSALRGVVFCLICGDSNQPILLCHIRCKIVFNACHAFSRHCIVYITLFEPFCTYVLAIAISTFPSGLVISFIQIEIKTVQTFFLMYCTKVIGNDRH